MKKTKKKQEEKEEAVTKCQMDFIFQFWDWVFLLGSTIIVHSTLLCYVLSSIHFLCLMGTIHNRSLKNTCLHNLSNIKLYVQL